MDKWVFLGNSFSHPYTHHPRIPLFGEHRPSACPLYPTYLITFGRDGMFVPSCMNLSTLWSRDCGFGLQGSAYTSLTVCGCLPKNALVLIRI